MKHLKIMIVALLVAVNAMAQEDFSKSLDGIQWVKIESKAKIDVKASQGNDLKIKVNSSYEIPEKAKGLKLVGNNGMDNTGVGFYIEKEGNTLIVRNLRNSNNGEAEIMIPASKNISVISNGLENIDISGFNGEVEATAEVVGNVTITDVSGPVTVNANTGTVQVVFNQVNQSSPISISTSTGNIDITIPGNTPANLMLNSTMGEIFSNFELNAPDEDGLKSISSRKIERKINNGGVMMKLSSSTGNIYLRKK